MLGTNLIMDSECNILLTLTYVKQNSISNYHSKYANMEWQQSITNCRILEAKTKTKKNSLVFSPQVSYTDRWTATAGEVGAYFCEQWVSRGQRRGSLRPLISVS
jgi:hypothetical protein